MVSTNLTLYAKWKIKIVTYHVIFNTNGGNAISSQPVIDGEKALQPSTPIKQDFIFEGWYTDTSLINLFDFSTPITSNITLFVKWNPSTYSPPIIQTVFVEGGTFTMGCTIEQGSDCYSDESPSHLVTLNSFNIGKYEIMQGEWRVVMGKNPSYFKACGDSCPVENVSWDDIQIFISKLNQQTDKNYRLPTESEWEYAARGGKQSRGYKYAGSNDDNLVAWYRDNGSKNTYIVGRKIPNELGIYDMSGNVWEWVSDWYSSYSQTPILLSTESYRVLRGGGWNYPARDTRVTYRYRYLPSTRINSGGFRLVLP